MTPIYDRLVAERGDPAVFAAHMPAAWAPWVFDLDKVHDLADAPITRTRTRTRKRRSRECAPS